MNQRGGQVMNRLRGHGRADGDEGFALIVVLLVGAVITALVVAIVSLTMTNLQSSGDHDRFEAAMAAAETGIDQQLAALQKNQSYSLGPAIGTAYVDATTEWTWALTTINNLIAGGTPYTSTGQGQYIAIKPSDRNVIYSLGCDPTCTAANAKKRLIKVEYIFAPYKPGNAILTAGNLSFTSSVTVDVSALTASGTANVHTNGDLSGGGSSQTVNGVLTASGAYSFNNGTVGPGSGGGTPYQTVPSVTARALYTTYSPAIANWYDLCPDGTVRAPGGTPCTGNVYQNLLVTGGSYRGWTFQAGSGPSGTRAPLWTMSSNTWGDGVYYVFQGDAVMNQNTVGNSISVIAEQGPSGGPAWSCGALGGNISAKLVTVNSAALSGVVFAAEGDLSVTSNFQGGIGAFAAGNQIQLETSANGITGTVVANDACRAVGTTADDPNGVMVNANEVKNAVVKYDKNVEVPLVDIIRTTQWIEMSARAS